MAEGALGIIDGQQDMKASEGLWLFDEDDWLLLAMLADPVYCAEMLFENPLNHDHGGCYIVLDFQYPLFRPASNYATFPCARSVGKTESIKARSVSHAFRRIGEDMLLTAPELIHLQPLTEAIEHRITSTRLTKDFLKKENQRTGIVKTPAFQVDFSDGTRIVGRIPKVTGPQPVTAKVLTPYGWTTMGELEPGDEVIGSDGSPIGVLGTMTPWESDVYELEFSDGSSTQADAHHLWSVRNDAQTIWRLRDTAEMMADLGGPAKHYGGSLNMWRVPAPPVVQYAPTHIRPPLDPYLVGVLLGDGSISGNGARLICHDQEIIDRVTSRLPSGCSLTVVSGRAGNYQIVGPDRHQANPVLDGLRSLGLMGKRAREKEIPDCYRFGTPTDRLELLRGLLDTDGAAKNGSAHLILASQPMIEQAAEIARSLGGWASVGQETIRAPGTLMAKGEEFDFGGGTYYRTTIRTHDVPFSLTRKAQKYNKGGRHRHRSVRAIKRIGKAKVCCIKVAADDGLYLTDQLIVTHNTGVKGMHEPDMIMDESQDYPDRGFTELHEAQPLDSRLLTPNGWIRMGDVEVGDHVVGSNGLRVRVLDVLDHDPREVVVVHFSDGSEVECDEDHLWTVTTGHYISSGRTCVKRTKEIEADLKKDGKRNGSRGNPWMPPTVGPIEFSVQPDLPVDPYVLGLLLGDGTLRWNSVRFTTQDQELIDTLRASLSDDEEFVATGGPDYLLRQTKRTVHSRPMLLEALDMLGCLGKLAQEKEVPRRYLWASSADRLALLQGLVDSDGNIHSSGALRYVTTSRQLAKDVQWLVLSLGGRMAMKQRADKRGFRDVYLIYARLPAHLIPARLARKAELSRPMDNNKMHRKIIQIERTGRLEPMRCIEVDASDGLYVADHLLLTHNTVMKDHMNGTGEYDFTYHLYGVHAAGQGGRFATLAASGDFAVTAVTAIMKPGWNKKEKAAAAAMYGGTNSPDYRRNILGEPGTGSSQFFVTSRLMACVDQNTESQYNQAEFVAQELQAEEVDKLIGDPRDVGKLLDLPDGLGQIVYAGMDVGLVNDPTVIQIWALRPDPQKRARLKLVRQFHLWRFREKQIRRCTYRIARHYGLTLRGFGQDITGLGLPLYQAMEDDEAECPDHLREVARGYVFNAKIPVAIDPEFVSKQGGELVDQYGHIVEERTNPFTGVVELLTKMTMIEASTRYLRKFVDETFLWLPFRPALVKDMQGETEQRVRAMGSPHLRKKPNAFHELDAMRAMAMSYMSAQTEEMAHQARPGPILDKALDFTGEGVLSRGGFELDPSGGVG